MSDFLEELLVFNQSQEGNNRYAMALDVLGYTRATLSNWASHVLNQQVWVSFESPTWWGLINERGIPSKHESSARVDYVPALCTDHPSLLPIKWFSEVFGLVLSWFHWRDGCQKVDQRSFRGSKSQPKVSVGEPAEGSLPFVNMTKTHCEQYQAREVTFWF